MSKRKQKKSTAARAPERVAVAAAAGADGETKPLKRSKARPESAEVQPSVRIYRDWSPDRLKRVLRRADGGSMSELADLCDQILADDRVRGAYEKVVGGLLSLPLTFEKAGDGRRSGAAAKALDAGEDWYRSNPEQELQQFITNGRTAGVSFAQLIWEPWNRRIVPRLQPWYLGHFRYDNQLRKWFARVGDGGSEVEVTPGDGRWLMYTPYGSHRPWALGQWRGLAPLWLLKQYAIADSGRLGEKTGTLVATPREQEFEGNDEQTGTIKDARRKLAADLASLASQGVVVLPNGFELELLHTPANTNAIYEKQWEFANTSIDITLCGQNLTSEVKEGSRAAADVHGRVESRIIRNVGSTSSTCFHDGQLNWWAAFNFGDPDLAPWPTWDTEVPEDTVATAEGIKAFGEGVSAVKAAGYKIKNIDEIADKFGLEVEEHEPPPAPAPGAPAGAQPAPGKGKKKADEDDEAPETRARREFVGALSTALASGAKLASNRGFIDGQLYVDAVVDYAAAAGNAALEQTLKAIRGAISDAADPADLRTRLRELFPEAAPEDLSDLSYKLHLMTELAGLRSVTQDA